MMKKIAPALRLAVMAALLTLAGVAFLGSRGDFVPAAVVHALPDGAGDGIFGDLEEELAAAAPNERFDTIVVLHKSVTTARLDALRRLAGDFGVDFEYHSIDGFAANLSKRQITALAKLDLVAQIEADRIVTPTLDQATLWFGVNKARTDFGVDGNADGAASYSKDDIVIAVLDTGIDAGVAAATKLSFEVKPSNFFEPWRLRVAQFFEDNSPFSVVLPPVLAGILFLYLLSRRFRLRVERRR